MMHESKLVKKFIDAKGDRDLQPSNDLVHIYVGPTGSGKTHRAYELHPNRYKGKWPTGGRWWWDDYKGEENIIFDEFRGNINYQQMLNLLDCRPMDVEFKGGWTKNVSTKVIITSIRHPRTWYAGVRNRTEFERRIQQHCRIFEFTEPTDKIDDEGNLKPHTEWTYHEPTPWSDLEMRGFQVDDTDFTLGNNNNNNFGDYGNM